MIPFKNRLKKLKDFEILFKEGYFIGGKIVSLKVWKIEPEKYPRQGYYGDDLKIGFSVGLKISKKAVVRNRIKRQLREAVRNMLKNNKIKSGFMVLVMAKPEIVGEDYKEIVNDVERVFAKID